MNNHIKKDLILNYIKNNNLTKTKFCKYCKISINTLNKILNNNNVFLVNIFKIARYMNIQTYLLFDNEPINKNK